MIGQLAPDSLLLLLIVKAHWPATPRGSSPKYQLPVNIDVNYRLFSMSAFGIYIFTSAEIFWINYANRPEEKRKLLSGKCKK